MMMEVAVTDESLTIRPHSEGGPHAIQHLVGRGSGHSGGLKGQSSGMEVLQGSARSGTHGGAGDSGGHGGNGSEATAPAVEAGVGAGAVASEAYYIQPPPPKKVEK